jgi:uncharacterized protein with HEPN domain
MAREPRAWLWDARTAVRLIRRFTDGRSFDDYLADDMMRSAVERQFEIVGEALGALRRHAPEGAARIPGLGRIVAFRNVLIHEYASVDDRLVWDVVSHGLAELERALDDELGDDPLAR